MNIRKLLFVFMVLTMAAIAIFGLLEDRGGQTTPKEPGEGTESKTSACNVTMK